MQSSDQLDVVFGVLLPLVVTLTCVLVFWALPVWLGIRWAKQKGYSPRWMLFGLHPVGAWIAAAVLQSLPARVQCYNCRQFIQQDFAVCPHCGIKLQQHGANHFG